MYLVGVPGIVPIAFLVLNVKEKAELVASESLKGKLSAVGVFEPPLLWVCILLHL